MRKAIVMLACLLLINSAGISATKYMGGDISLLTKYE